VTLDAWSSTAAGVKTSYALAKNEAVSIASSNQSYRCDIDAAVGDTIYFDDVEISASRRLFGFTS